MSKRCYIAVGHGQAKGGKYQPGAVDPATKTQEHQEAHRVVEVIRQALLRSGVDHYSESDSGPSHDPNYQESAKAVNAGKYDLAIEVHFDAFNQPEGGFGIYTSSKGRDFTHKIAERWKAAGLKLRPHQDRNDLYFLNATNCPAVIWECDRIGPQKPSDWILAAGEAIAAGICDYLGVPNYVAPGGIVAPGPTPTPAPASSPPAPPRPPETEKDRIKQLQVLVGFRGKDVDGDFGPLTEGACNRNLVGWLAEVNRKRRARGAKTLAYLPGNGNSDLVKWLQRQGPRKGYALDDDGDANGPQTNHLVTIVLGQSDSICGARGFRNAVR